MERPDFEERRRRQARTPMLILGSVMIIFYICLGIFLLIKPSWLRGLDADFVQIFAGMLLIYGGYRGWRLYCDYF